MKNDTAGALASLIIIGIAYWLVSLAKTPNFWAIWITLIVLYFIREIFIQYLERRAGEKLEQDVKNFEELVKAKRQEIMGDKQE